MSQNGKPRLQCVDGRHPSSDIPAGVLPLTCQSEWKQLSRQTGGQSNPHKWLAKSCFLEDLKCGEA